MAKCPEIGWDELGNFLGKLEEILKTENTLGQQILTGWLSTPFHSDAVLSHVFLLFYTHFFGSFLGAQAQELVLAKNRGGIAQRVQLS